MTMAGAGESQLRLTFCLLLSRCQVSLPRFLSCLATLFLKYPFVTPSTPGLKLWDCNGMHCLPLPIWVSKLVESSIVRHHLMAGTWAQRLVHATLGTRHDTTCYPP